MHETLNQLANKEISSKKAYKELFKRKNKKRKKAHFVKVKIRVPDQKGVNVLLAIVLCLPIPLFIVRKIALLNKGDDTDDIDIAGIINELRYKPFSIKVTAASGEKIYIKAL